MSSRKGAQSGFALPTVVIASVMLFTILVAAVSATTSVRSAIDAQVGDQLAREAIEAGSARAQECLEANDYVALWTDVKPLRPWTDCSGNALATCPGTSSLCSVVNNGRVRTTFTVLAPTGGSGSAAQIVPVSADTSLYRNTLSSGVAKEYNVSSKGRAGQIMSLENVYFGYIQSPFVSNQGELGAFYYTMTGDGKLRGAGYNQLGQLSTGSFATTTTPELFQGLPPGLSVKKVFTQFKSGDASALVLMSDGSLYGVGDNWNGQLGRDPAVSGQVEFSAAIKYPVPGNEKVKTAFNGTRTYVVTEQGKLYASGACDEIGILPSQYSPGNNTYGGCFTPKPVHGLPTPVVGNPSTIVKEIVHDGTINYVLMEGGQLYGWGVHGASPCGLAGGGTVGDSQTPIRIGSYGNPGQPKVVKVETDGRGVYVLLSDGTLDSAGCNEQGALGSTATRIQSRSTNNGDKCIDVEFGNTGTNGTWVQYYDCSSSQFAAAQEWAFDENYQIRNKGGKCLDLSGNNRNNGNKVQIWDCNANPAQQWVFRDDGSIRLLNQQGKCLSAQSAPPNDWTKIVIWDCDGNDWQKWRLRDQPYLRPVNVPPGSIVKDMASDFATFYLLLDTDADSAPDTVMGYGLNHLGQLGGGNGVVQNVVPRMTRFNIGAEKAVAIGHAAHGMTANDTKSASNTLVVTASGKVFGAGGNVYGQLGTGSTAAYVATPQQMLGVANAKIVRTGANMSVVITHDNRVYTAGRNNFGQLGDGTTVDSPVPKMRRYLNQIPITLF